MKEFAHSIGVFKGWNNDEQKRKALYAKLMGVISDVCALPFGNIILMDLFRQYSETQQGYFGDPYYFVFYNCVIIAADLLSPIASSGERMAMVFSDQVEFRHRAQRLYEIVRNGHPCGQSLDAPVFRDMRQLVPLQGADIVAYEIFKECERQLYTPTRSPRWGYIELLKITRKSANFLPFISHDRETLEILIRNAEKRK